MPPHAVPVTLTAAERKILTRRARGAKTPCRDRERAQIFDSGNERAADAVL